MDGKEFYTRVLLIAHLILSTCLLVVEGWLLAIAVGLLKANSP